MLRAFNQCGNDVLAMQVQREDGPFYCPVCQEQLILKKGKVKMSHFAHQPDTDCSYASQGESEEHREAKLAMYQALLSTAGVTNVQLERYLQEVRPDVSFEYDGCFIAVEVQISTLSPGDIERRTLAYTRKNIAVLWTPPLPSALSPLAAFLEPRYAPRDWERYLHSLYFGNVYYWSNDLQLQPVHFEEYWLSPSWYSGERRSRRFVTPSLLHPCSILDLTPVWRNRWRSLPRAKLWSEPSAER